MNIVKSLWKFLIFTNLLIALAAAAQTLLSYEIFALPYNFNIILLEFTSTILLYNLSIWLSKPNDPLHSPYERTRWIYGHMAVFWGLSSTAGLVLLYVLSQVQFETLLYLGIIGALSLAYALPIVKIGGKWKSFRHLPYIKVFHIALIWSLSTVGLVYVESINSLLNVTWESLIYLLGCKFLFILLVTLPFDIRDMKQDSYYHLKTVPLVLGRAKAKMLCYGLGILHIILVVNMPTSQAVKMGIIACDLLVLYLFKRRIFKDRNSFVDVYLLDLILVIQYILCLFSIQISNNFVG